MQYQSDMSEYQFIYGMQIEPMPFITGIVSILPPIIIGILLEYIVFKFLFIRLL